MERNCTEIRSVAGESKYAEFDPEFGFWGVFGEDSGFCFGQFNTEEEAEAHC